MRNIKITLSFDGTDFSGWQRQKNAITIQGEIEKALSRITNVPVNLHGAGRTDAGVHALAMVANFTTESNIVLPKLQNGLNSLLPFSIRIFKTEEVPPGFHARFSALSKTYLYHIDTSPIQSPFARLFSVHIPQNLSISKMEHCLQIITGTHDFESFEASGSRDKSITTGRGSIRTLHAASVHKTEMDAYQFEFTGDGFLRHMVRNIMGTVLNVGKEKTSIEKFKEILAAKDRSCAGGTAPAHGLFLKKIYYKH